MKSDDTFIDVLYCNDEDEFEPQFTMSQVTQELDARSSKITYWCKRYKLDALVERINNKKDRCFSIYEIKILRKIKSLKDKDLNSKKIEELIADDLEILKERKIKMAEETQKAEEMIQYNQNEQIVEMLASRLAGQLSSQISNEMMNMKNSIVDELSVTITNNIQGQLSESFKTSSEATKEQLNDLEMNLSSKIDSALEGQLDNLKHAIDEQEHKFIEKDLDRIELFKNSMEEHKKIQEEVEKELEKERNKGFFKRLFK